MLTQNHNIKNSKSIILFTSESCNLRCSYCDMASHINRKLHAEEAKKVKESLLNGQYLNTIQTCLNRLNIDPKQMEHFEIWGQEPTLTLKEFNIMFPQLYELCPNLESSMFSTNGVGFIDDIIEYISVIQKTVNHNFHIKIQFSYDGDIVNKQNRGIDSSIILNNITNFIKKLNNIKLNNVDVEIQFHNVINADIINYYSNRNKNDELYTFLNNFSELSKNFISLNTNTNVKIMPFSPGLITPYNATVEEGKNLAEFYRNCREVGKSIKEFHNWPGLTHQFYHRFLDLKYEEIYPFLRNVIKYNKLDIKTLKLLSSSISCGFNYGAIKIRYDGKMILCQNAIMGLTEEELKGKTDLDSVIQKRKLQKNFYPNIVTDSDEIIDNYLYQINLFHEQSYLESFSQLINLMTMLLKAGQIDKKYENPELFLKTVYYFSIMTNCPYNAMMASGSLYGHYAGYIRFFCNGFLDLIEEESEYFIKLHREDQNNSDY